jgi:hypothetical protein
MSVDKRLTKDQQKKIKPAKQGGGLNYLGKQETVTVPKKWLSSPDHVVAELAYITPREQKILLDANIYGSLKGKPNKGPGGIMSLQGDMGSVGGGNTGGNNNGGGGNTNRERGIMSQAKGPKGTTGNIGGFTDTGPDRGAVSQFSTFGRNVMNQRLQGPSVFSKIGTGIKDYITGGGLIGMGIRGLTGLVNKFTGPKATEYGNLNMPGYNMLNIAGPVTRAAPTGDGEGGDGSNNQQLYAATNQYPIMGTTSEEGIETLVNNPGFIQRFRVKNPYRQDKQGQLDPAILEMINKLYT